VLDIVNWPAYLVLRCGLLSAQTYHQRLIHFDVVDVTVGGITDTHNVLYSTTRLLLAEVGGNVFDFVLTHSHQPLLLFALFSVLVDLNAVAFTDDWLELLKGDKLNTFVLLFLGALSHNTNKDCSAVPIIINRCVW
jgi:hypothetical protein